MCMHIYIYIHIHTYVDLQIYVYMFIEPRGGAAIPMDHEDADRVLRAASENLLFGLGVAP